MKGRPNDRSTLSLDRPATQPRVLAYDLRQPAHNLFDPEVTASLQGLVDLLEADDEVKVVFDSADPEHFMAHLDFLRAEELDLAEHIAQFAPAE
jgi:enoyl-CoA hydratase/carnithine racemase